MSELVPIEFEYSSKKYLLSFYFTLDKSFIFPQSVYYKAIHSYGVCIIKNYGKYNRKVIIDYRSDIYSNNLDYYQLRQTIKDIFSKYSNIIENIYGRQCCHINTFNRLFDDITLKVQDYFNNELNELFWPLGGVKQQYTVYANEENKLAYNVIYNKVGLSNCNADNFTLTIFNDNFSQIVFYECVEDVKILEKHLALYCGKEFSKKFFEDARKENNDVL